MQTKAIILILNELIKYGDLKDLNAFLKVFDILLNTSLDSLYYFDNSIYTKEDIKENKYYAYISTLELELIKINKINYHIGYIEDIIQVILLNYYDLNDISLLSDNKALKLLNILINKKDFKFYELKSLNDFLKSNDFNDMALDYLKLSIQSDLKENTKKEYLKKVFYE